MGPLYYKFVLKSKDNSLKYNNGNFNTNVKFRYDALPKLKWWKGIYYC